MGLNPRITAQPNGGFTIDYLEDYIDNGPGYIKGAAIEYSANGSVAVPKFYFNGDGTYDHRTFQTNISALANGNPIIAYREYNTKSTYSIFDRTTGAFVAGGPVGAAGGFSTGTDAAVAGLINGDFVFATRTQDVGRVSGASSGQDVTIDVYSGIDYSLKSQVVITGNGAYQNAPRDVIALNDGGYVVTYLSAYNTGGNFVTDYHVATFNGDGSSRNNFILPHSNGSGTTLKMTALDNGAFVVAYTNDTGFFVQAFKSDGTADGTRSP